jgi:hypothetical protein
VIERKARYSFGRILTLATDSRVMSWPVIIVCAVLSVLIHLAPNGGTVEGSIFVRIVVATLAYIPGLGVIAAVSLAVRNLKPGRARTTIMLTSYFIGGALRGVFMSISFYSLGMASALNLDFRVPGSAIPFGLAIAAATYAITALDESKERIRALRALQGELQSAVEDSSNVESSLRERTISKIEESVEGELASLSHISDTSTPAELKALALDVVRPLSHSLAERVPIWEAKESLPLSIKWREIFNQVRPELSLKPVLLSSLSTATALTAFVTFFGITLAIPLTICSLVLIYVATLAAEKVSGRLNSIRNLFVRGTSMTALLVLVSVPAGLVNAIILQDVDDPFFALRGGLMIVPIFGWFIALGGAAQAESRRIESEYSDGIAQLSWLKARLNLMNWYEQGEFARVLHGPVQSAINKGIIKLGADAALSKKAVIAEVREGIATALSPSLRLNGERRSFEQLCDDLAATWVDLCQIDFAISPQARAALNADTAGASVCWDIIHESCGNAIQHGKARWVSVRISDPLERLVAVDVVDNGTDYVLESKPGMGSNMLDACTLTWSRIRKDGQTTLRAELPVHKG